MGDRDRNICYCGLAMMDSGWCTGGHGPASRATPTPPPVTRPEREEEIAAVKLLTECGYGVVSPTGLWWNANIARSCPGQMVLATERKPIFGMVGQHEVKP